MPTANLDIQEKREGAAFAHPAVRGLIIENLNNKIQIQIQYK